MKFEIYDRMMNHDHKNTLDKIFEQGGAMPSRKWCITEKVHGAHFDIAWDGHNKELIEFWSRKRVLSKDKNFNNYHRIREYLEECMQRAYKLVSMETNVKGGFELIICGELIGGTYPHKDVEEVMNVRRIQKGVFYHPDIVFYAYDIKINGEFINYYSAYHILKRSNFFPADILCEGSFEKCMKYSNKFQTTIPKLLKLPEIEDNICEGWVLKTIKPERFLDGNRVILKSKNAIYDERARCAKIPREPLVLTEKAQKIYDIISTYVTENRLDSVLSKVDRERLTLKEGFGAIMGDFRKDVMESFNDDYEGWINTLEKADKVQVSKLIGKLCVPLVKKEWVQILE